DHKAGLTEMPVFHPGDPMPVTGHDPAASVAWSIRACQPLLARRSTPAATVGPTRRRGVVRVQRRIAVVGTGYVGLTTGACLAAIGHRVVCADIDAAKIARLRAGEVDILEPGLAELVRRGIAAGRLEFVLGARAAI